MCCSSEVGNAAGAVSEKKVIQSATRSSHEGVSRTERQSTASKWGATCRPRYEASVLSPMPPIPSRAIRRECSCTIHCVSSAISTSATPCRERVVRCLGTHELRNIGRYLKLSLCRQRAQELPFPHAGA